MLPDPAMAATSQRGIGITGRGSREAAKRPGGRHRAHRVVGGVVCGIALLAIAGCSRSTGTDSAASTTAAPDTTAAPGTTAATTAATTVAPDDTAGPATTVVPATAAPPATTAAPVATTTAPPLVCPPAWTLDPKVTAGWPSQLPATGSPRLADAGLGGHPEFDRFVLDFADGAGDLSYSVRWIAGGPTYDGSGDPVPMAGTAFMEVRVIGVASWALDPADWYAGPTDLAGSDAGTSNVAQATQSGDFEGYVTWHIGADHPAPFDVFTLADPTRLVVDVCAV